MARQRGKKLPGYDSQRHNDILVQARRNIADMRMRVIAVRFVDHTGAPVPHLKVEAVQTGHAFPFGDQLATLHNMHEAGQWDTERARQWRWRFAELFNASNSLCYWTERPENSITRVEPHQGNARLDGFDATVDWALSQGLQTKGHPLFWCIPKCIPDWAQRYDTRTLMKFVEVRVRNLVARYRGRVSLWDAVNEPMWETSPATLHTRRWPHIEDIDAIVGYIAPVLRWCREEDPCARFVVNDYGMQVDRPEGALKGSDDSRVTAGSQRARYIDMLRRLCDAGSPPDAVGLQSHIGWMEHDTQWAMYDEFSGKTGLPVHITEFWANMHDMPGAERCSEDDLAHIKAEYIANFLTCAFGHPAIDAFFFWGLMDQAVTWDNHYAGNRTTPVYDRVKELLREEWYTRIESTTDADGVMRFRGFHGSYDLRPRASRKRAVSGYRIRSDATVGMPITLTV